MTEHDSNSKMAQIHKALGKTPAVGMAFDVLSVVMFLSTFVFVNVFQFKLSKVNHA